MRDTSQETLNKKPSFIVFLFSSGGKGLNGLKSESSILQISLIFKAKIFLLLS